jgi:hypothetical protein
MLKKAKMNGYSSFAQSAPALSTRRRYARCEFSRIARSIERDPRRGISVGYPTSPLLYRYRYCLLFLAVDRCRGILERFLRRFTEANK